MLLLNGVEETVSRFDSYTLTVNAGTGTALVEYSVDGMGFQELMPLTSTDDNFELPSLPACKIKATLTGDAQVAFRGGDF
jgi:hypothetical protein